MNMKLKNLSSVFSFTLLKIFSEKFLQAVIRVLLMVFEEDESRRTEEIWQKSIRPVYACLTSCPVPHRGPEKCSKSYCPWKSVLYFLFENTLQLVVKIFDQD